MIIDPKTTVGQLITALPSTMPLLQSYGVSLEQTTDQPLWKVLMDVQVEIDEFLHAVDEIDWSAEFPLKPGESRRGEAGAEERSPERG
jgi:hypothetical protein